MRSITWLSTNLPQTITQGATQTTFAYGPEQQRVRQTQTGPALTVYYAGAIEKEISASTTRIKTYLPRGIGYLEEVINSGSAALTASATPGHRYFHTDHQGSTIAITDEARTKEALSYDVWGKRRNSDGSDDTSNTLTSARDRHGYTGQEHLDAVNLIHMNGRVYDPIVARFVSPDPTVTDPGNPQNLNRYSYVYNNPLNYTDPSGFMGVLNLTEGYQNMQGEVGFSHGLAISEMDNLRERVCQLMDTCNQQGLSPGIGGFGGLLKAFGADTAEAGNSDADGVAGQWHRETREGDIPVDVGIFPRFGANTEPATIGGGCGGLCWTGRAINGVDDFAFGGQAQEMSRAWRRGAYGESIARFPLGVAMGAMTIASGGTASTVRSGIAQAEVQIARVVPKVADPKLANLVRDLYKGAKMPNPIGTGSTADAIRNELSTGLPTNGVFHSDKGTQYINALTKWLNKNPAADFYDRLVGESLLNDLKDALRLP